MITATLCLICFVVALLLLAPGAGTFEQEMRRRGLSDDDIREVARRVERGGK